MSNPAELALVVKALKSGLGGCVEWDAAVVDRLEEDLARSRLTRFNIRKKVIEYVRNGGEVVQHEEDREGWKDQRDHWYHVIVPVGAFPKGLFVEIALVDPDPELPEIEFINAHEEV